jgi:hypothetical protein
VGQRRHRNRAAARSHRDDWFDDPAKIVKPVGAELIGDGYTPLGSSNITAITLEEPPSRSPRTRFAAAWSASSPPFHGDDPELAAPVLERVCSQAMIMEQPAMMACHQTRK